MARLSARFHVGSRLGSGGAGHVYPARERATGRVLAVKMIRNVDHDDPNFVERFKREGAIHQGLRGRHILEVMEHGAWDEGLAIVMELAQGPSLAGAIDAVKARGERPFEVLFPLLDQAMSGVAEVHAVDVIHRDLKPENILTTVERGVLVAKVADFGLARNVDNSMTRTNTAMGTPCYASPEQFRDASRVDHRTDIYSFGVMLYQLMTGERPYDGDSFFGVGNACVKGEWELPRKRDPSLPPAADDLIRTAMALDASDRFASVQALQAAARGLAAELGVDLAAKVPADIAEGPPVHFDEDKGPPAAPSRPVRSAGLLGMGVLALGALGLGTLVLAAGGAWYAGLFDRDDGKAPVVVEGETEGGEDAPGGADPKEADPGPDKPVTVEAVPDKVKPDKVKPAVQSPVKKGNKKVSTAKPATIELEPDPVLATLRLIAQPGTVDAGGTSTITLTALADDGSAYSLGSPTTDVTGGSLSAWRDQGAGQYGATLSVGDGESSRVVVSSEGQSAEVSVRIRPKQPAFEYVSLRFSCIGCASDMTVTDPSGKVTFASASGQVVQVAAGNLTIEYGGQAYTVAVATSNTKVKCSQTGCRTY